MCPVFITRGWLDLHDSIVRYCRLFLSGMKRHSDMSGDNPRTTENNYIRDLSVLVKPFIQICLTLLSTVTFWIHHVSRFVREQYRIHLHGFPDDYILMTVS